MVDGETRKTEETSFVEKAETFYKSRLLPATSAVFVYSIAFLCSIFVVFKLLKRYATQPGKLIFARKRPLPPKILDDPQLGNHQYIQLPHVKLHYVEAGDKSKPLMIFIHGFPEFWYCWRHQIKDFSKDYWTVAFDMRGYGDSEKPQNVKYYHMKYLVNDVKNLIEGLGREKAILVSHDWGGIVAWYMAIKYPEMVDKLIVLNAPYPAAFSKILWSNLGQFLKSWYMFFFQLPWLPELQMYANDMVSFKILFKSKKNGSVLKEEDLEAYKFMYGKSGSLFGPIAFYRANFASFSKRPKPVENSEYPKALLIFGDDDLALDVKTVELSKKMYPNLTTEIITGACHFVQEDEPEVVNSKIREFLSS